ncbi:MAG: hypothetical protein JSW20_05070 [Nitrospiraceae bacterium]|nr:MAG: hypothetical protein JSW20_05070 [Nitrospiraceae bacterium]
MLAEFEKIITYIIGTELFDNSLCGVNIPDQFHPENPDGVGVEENLNAAFLIILAGETHPLYREAAEYIRKIEMLPEWKDKAGFYVKGRENIISEISSACDNDPSFAEHLIDLSTWIQDPANAANRQISSEMIRNFFFPEGKGPGMNMLDEITSLRNKRSVDISSLNRTPITDPVKQLVFTSNVLITTPVDIDSSFVSDTLRHKLKSIVDEDQLFWYDHPIPVGISPDCNEILYGLDGLDRAVAFEKEKGTIDRESKLTCLLSVSVTHKGLQQIAKRYLEEELVKNKNISHLDIYIFTESDSRRLIDEILLPAAVQYNMETDASLLHEVFGVDGEYGRHYSFLKAVAAFWQVLIYPEIKGTFKIDLDQIFPQENLVEQTGHSAFEHFKTPLWGARGTDWEGNQVELGMIAGALVNQTDMKHSLFFPDVCFPPNEMKADELVFFSKLPQALSTEAEMMTRYTDRQPDGIHQCIQRFHVTGGTNGILLDSLRKHRPFTPSIIGRAEDQAYILSVIFKEHDDKLRYVHKDGLIMRHDKETFAVEAIKKAAIGKMIGDYIRILLFSYYCRALPWSADEIKKEVDPFTGCFISKIPLTVVYLRFALKTASLIADSSGVSARKGKEFMKSGCKRIGDTISYLTQDPNPLIDLYKRGKKGWDMFYDILDIIEGGLADGDAFTFELKKKAFSVVESCKVNV